MSEADKNAIAVALMQEDARLYIGHYYLVYADAMIEIYLNHKNRSTYLATTNTYSEAIEFVKKQMG